jgi:hypothetical protein
VVYLRRAGEGVLCLFAGHESGRAVYSINQKSLALGPLARRTSSVDGDRSCTRV